MSTIGQHISNMRGLLVKYSRTQENWTDQFLYEILNGARTEYLKNIEKKFNHTSEWALQTFTMELEEVDPPNWECVPTYLKKKCKVKKSKYKIPQPIKSRNKSIIQFQTLGGEAIDLYTEDEQTIYKDDKIRSRSIMASIVNGYLYIWNNPDLKFIKVTAIWQNPVDWASIPDCTGTLDTCFNILTSEYPLDEDDKNAVYKIAFELFGIPIKLKPDQTNDSNEFNKG